MIQQILVVAPVNDAHKEQLQAAAPAQAQIVYSTYKTATSEQIAAADVIFGNLSPAQLQAAKHLKWLQLNSAGADVYTPAGVLPAGCLLTTVVGAYGLTVSEHTIAMLMSMNRKLPQYYQNQQQALWRSRGAVKSIEGATILILGAGNIGCDIARKVKALGAYTIGTRRAGAQKPDCLDELYTLDELDGLLPRADDVIICLPDTPQTQGLFNARRLALMKPDATLVNIGRGPIVDTNALMDALEREGIGGACLDVTDPEPLPAEHPLWRCPNVLITPHVAGKFYLPETMNRIVAIACENLQKYAKGKLLRNLVSLA